MPKATIAPAHERRRRFVECFMGKAAGVATTAVLMAGLTKNEHSARVIGTRLLADASVRAMIAERQSKDPRIATREERQQLLSEMMTDATRPDPVRLKALELLGKTQGDFIEQSEVRQDVVYHLHWDEEPVDGAPKALPAARKALPPATARRRKG